MYVLTLKQMTTNSILQVVESKGSNNVGFGNKNTLMLLLKITHFKELCWMNTMISTIQVDGVRG